MPSNKDRLYLALYARGGAPQMPGLEDSYHWAFVTGPKVEPKSGGQGTRFHAKEGLISVGEPPTPQWVWTYEEKPIPLQPTQMLLVRVVIGKIKDQHRVRATFERTPIRSEVPGWNCVAWAEEAFRELLRDRKALDKAVDNWDLVRDTAMWYVEQKKADHRFDGQGQYDQSRAATWDMLLGEELIP
ncbi:Uncharacterized protein TPAR_04048 [Tolypocladium paradoxum]|uniref:Uncharacterized protein n=1 Tax=Tolypocladium paradoxum TaxID=94208 RepID=A0A2S4L001_9HYPO|nr:Uncharacterized protein TPAR_04048 [Tolypocladium paradoxum]